MTGGMFYGGVGVCPCHGEPWYIVPGGQRSGKRLCVVKKLAVKARYDQTEKGRAAHDRYERSEKGQANRARHNARLVYVGQYYVGYAPTVEHADFLNAEAREHFRRKDDHEAEAA